MGQPVEITNLEYSATDLRRVASREKDGQVVRRHQAPALLGLITQCRPQMRSLYLIVDRYPFVENHRPMLNESFQISRALPF